MMVDEFTQESQLTQSVLDVVPESLMAKQMADSLRTIGWNACHLADIPNWADMILNRDRYDIGTPEEPNDLTPDLATMNAVNALFRKNVDQAIRILKSFHLESLEEPWSLYSGEQVLMTLPRYLIYRKFMINHVAHHRGHLLAYLRINGVETPRIYG